MVIALRGGNCVGMRGCGVRGVWGCLMMVAVFVFEMRDCSVWESHDVGVAVCQRNDEI